MDYSHEVRRAVLMALKATGDVTALIPAASIYPTTVPATRAFPFTRYGAPIATPFRASGLDSSSGRPTVHVFTKPLYDGGGAMIRTAEHQCEIMTKAIGQALDGSVLTLDGGMRATLSWVGTNSLPDPTEADSWHGVVNFSADVAG